MAVTALIASLLPCIPVVAPGTALVLGIMVLAQKRPGRGMAIAAIVIGAIGLIGQFIGFSVFVDRVGDGVQRERERRDDGYETITTMDLETGDCIESLAIDETGETFEVDSINRVPCDEPHEWEVIANKEVPGGGEYPGEDEVITRTDRFCAAEFKTFVGRGVARSELEMYIFFPQKASWDLYEDYDMSCVIGEGLGKPFDGSLRDSNR